MSALTAISGDSNMCTIPLAGGPPAKPNKGTDFAKNAVAKNVGRNVSRNILTQLGGRFGGGLGAAVAGGAAKGTIRTEQDLKGSWTITDGASGCGCAVKISSGVNLQMKSSNKGRLSTKGCGNQLVAQASYWALGHTFTGYGATFELMASDKKTVIAHMKRDGLNYFSGTMVNGTAITMWRRGG
ncbi:MAG: hypothetical protein COA52_03025 [Hyphomicrobiales bacterium]|nr:MAG: hypothetical protein COA52_03025 [Hyphomicrobiales bacterium]